VVQLASQTVEAQPMAALRTLVDMRESWAELPSAAEALLELLAAAAWSWRRRAQMVSVLQLPAADLSGNKKMRTHDNSDVKHATSNKQANSIAKAVVPDGGA
jgi:hypothetical protein